MFFRLLRIALLRLSRHIYIDSSDSATASRAAVMMSPELNRHLEALKTEASQLSSQVPLQVTVELLVLLTTMETSLEDASHQLAFECLTITQNFIKKWVGRAKGLNLKTKLKLLGRKGPEFTLDLGTLHKLILLSKDLSIFYPLLHFFQTHIFSASASYSKYHIALHQTVSRLCF